MKTLSVIEQETVSGRCHCICYKTYPYRREDCVKRYLEEKNHMKSVRILV